MSPWGADSISQSKEAEKTTRGRDSPVVRNLTLLYAQVTSLGASGSGRLPQGANGSSTPVDWEKVVLTHQHRELTVPANLLMKVTTYMLLSRQAEEKKNECSNTEPPFESSFLSAGSQ
jgi:hypothetical protein